MTESYRELVLSEGLDVFVWGVPNPNPNPNPNRRPHPHPHPNPHPNPHPRPHPHPHSHPHSNLNQVRRAAPRDALAAKLAALWGVQAERLRYQVGVRVRIRVRVSP